MLDAWKRKADTHAPAQKVSLWEGFCTAGKQSRPVKFLKLNGCAVYSRNRRASSHSWDCSSWAQRWCQRGSWEFGGGLPPPTPPHFKSAFGLPTNWQNAH